MSPEPTGLNVRQVSAMEVDVRGRIFVASALDPDVDGGPFCSVVWDVGNVRLDKGSGPVVVLVDPPRRMGTFKGFKVEGLAAREGTAGVELFVVLDRR